MTDFKSRKLEEVRKSFECLIYENMLNMFTKSCDRDVSELLVDTTKEQAEHLAHQLGLAFHWATLGFSRFDWDCFFDRVRDTEFIERDDHSALIDFT